MIKEADKLLIVQRAQGNPGATRVLYEVYAHDLHFFLLLAPSLIATSSKSYGLWIVYKDMCKFDIAKTCAILRTWADESTAPLEVWCAERGVL